MGTNLYFGRKTDVFRQEITESMEKTPIILMHDGTEICLDLDNPGEAVQNYIRSRESNVAALPDIIDFLQSRGYTFAGVGLCPCSAILLILGPQPGQGIYLVERFPEQQAACPHQEIYNSK